MPTTSCLAGLPRCWQRPALLIGNILLLLPLAASGADRLAVCAGIRADAERLACYDRLSKRLEPAPPGGAVVVTASPAVLMASGSAPSVEHQGSASLLDRRWELAASGERFGIRPYKPTYLLPVFWGSKVNTLPSSPAAGNTIAAPLALESTEAKFQISFKSLLVDNLFGDNGDLWAGYTQSSRWQLYNADLSRPFRETNYEPEAMFIWRTNIDLLGAKVRYGGLSLNHQSNGRANPLSRSWNRVIASVGLEGADWTLTLRPWWRLPEGTGKDDNPGLENYAGRGEAVLTKVLGNHQFSLQARHSLRSGDNAHGSLLLDWAFPIAGRLKGHVQWHNGYAESLIDYNHKAQYLGLGISLVEWH